jgi:FtsP/CotA-like multicopper oxidase with cupredoxin domain
LWYHDHALGVTRLNVYAGLAGLYIIRDEFDTGLENNPLGLPAGPYELGYVIQDRMFKENGDLFFPAFEGDPAWDDFIVGEGATPPIPGGPSALAEFFGDHIVVNGKIWPKVNVESRHYRMRLLNGSDSRFMRLRFRMVSPGEISLAGASKPLEFFVIGSDQGFIKDPIKVKQIDFMPGERLDVVFDFTTVPSGARVIVENILGDAPFGGTLPAPEDLFPDRRTDRIMAFDVVLPVDTSVADRYAQTFQGGVDRKNENKVNRVRKLALFEGLDEYGRLMPMLGTAEPVTDVAGNVVTGAMTWAQPITENPGVGDTEIWEIYNTTGDAHPIHVHLVHFDILDRRPFIADVIEQPVIQHNGAEGVGFRLENVSLVGKKRGAADTEKAPKDMVMALPGEMTRIKMTFDKAGRYVWHCHILSHEDHEMMRAFHVGPGPF